MPEHRTQEQIDTMRDDASFVPGRLYAFETEHGTRYRELFSAEREWCYTDGTGQRHLKDTVRELTEAEWKKLRGETDAE